MKKTSERRTWMIAAAAGLFAALLGVVALLIDLVQGDPMNWAVLPAIGAGLLVALLSLAQRRKGDSVGKRDGPPGSGGS